MKLADFSILFCGVLLNALAQLGLKAATKVTGPLVTTDGALWSKGAALVSVPSLWLALGAYGLSVIVWLVGLSRVPVSQAYPLLSLDYVINIGLAWWLPAVALAVFYFVNLFRSMRGKVSPGQHEH